MKATHLRAPLSLGCSKPGVKYILLNASHVATLSTLDPILRPLHPKPDFSFISISPCIAHSSNRFHYEKQCICLPSGFVTTNLPPNYSKRQADTKICVWSVFRFNQKRGDLSPPFFTCTTLSQSHPQISPCNFTFCTQCIDYDDCPFLKCVDEAAPLRAT